MNRPVVLDMSFLVALERETANAEQGPARRFLPSLRGRPLVVSIVTVEELLEGATDEAAALASLQRFSIHTCAFGEILGSNVPIVPGLTRLAGGSGCSFRALGPVTE